MFHFGNCSKSDAKIHFIDERQQVYPSRFLDRLKITQCCWVKKYIEYHEIVFNNSV